LGIFLKFFAIVTLSISTLGSAHGAAVYSTVPATGAGIRTLGAPGAPPPGVAFDDVLRPVDAPAPRPVELLSIDAAPSGQQPSEPAVTRAQPAPPAVTRVAAAPPPPPPAAPAAAPAAPPFVIGSAQQALINQDRAAAGLPPLNWSGCLAGIAGAQGQAMASAGTIFHGNGVQRDWSCGLGSSQTGENVGEWGAGINDAGINQLFLASAPHRANIMGPYHYVGTAWVVSGGKGYIAVEFA
jgi:uncharacterized protein YkwD